MIKSKKAFTMVELIFVIVIMGILVAVVIPRLVATRDDALIVKNIEYIIASMTEISTYIVSKNSSKDDLTEMSSILTTLKSKNEVIVDTNNKSVKVKIGEEADCITISIESDATTELLKTSFVNTTDRICNMVQLAIKEKDYPLILRGRLIQY
jgi:prepilin-type N-terminal cleavage/methylation domain-containing protein